MAIVTIPAEQRTLNDEAAIRDHLASIGITYERLQPSHTVADDATAAEILAAFDDEI